MNNLPKNEELTLETQPIAETTENPVAENVASAETENKVVEELPNEEVKDASAEVASEKIEPQPKTEKSPVKRAKYVKPTAEQLQNALIVIDMQNDFVSGVLGGTEAQGIVDKVVARVEAYISEGKDVIFTRDTHFGDYAQTQEGNKLPVAHCIKDTDGWQIIDQLKEKAVNIIDKPTFGSFALANACVNKKYAGVELVGLCTDICVIANAFVLKTALPESTIVVNSQCTAGTSIKAATSAIFSMRKCQIDII